jgi:nucleoid-associated protein YgaU
LKEGETLQNIAYRYYGDSGKWYIIAEYNNIINPFTELKGGMVLMIPAYGS